MPLKATKQVLESLKKERRELEDNFSRLSNFISSNDMCNVRPAQQDLLFQQHAAMRLYQYILDLRVKEITNFLFNGGE